MLTKAQKQTLLDAFRSGKYKQGFHELAQDKIIDGKLTTCFCAQGLTMEVLGPDLGFRRVKVPNMNHLWMFISPDLDIYGAIPYLKLVEIFADLEELTSKKFESVVSGLLEIPYRNDSLKWTFESFADHFEKLLPTSD